MVQEQCVDYEITTLEKEVGIQKAYRNYEVISFYLLLFMILFLGDGGE
jgi:hypothetical protein